MNTPELILNLLDSGGGDCDPRQIRSLGAPARRIYYAMGVLVEQGFVERKVVLTKQGREALAKYRSHARVFRPREIIQPPDILDKLSKSYRVISDERIEQIRREAIEARCQ